MHPKLNHIVILLVGVMKWPTNYEVDTFQRASGIPWKCPVMYAITVHGLAKSLWNTTCDLWHKLFP